MVGVIGAPEEYLVNTAVQYATHQNNTHKLWLTVEHVSFVFVLLLDLPRSTAIEYTPSICPIALSRRETSAMCTKNKQGNKENLTALCLFFRISVLARCVINKESFHDRLVVQVTADFIVVMCPSGLCMS